MYGLIAVFAAIIFQGAGKYRINYIRKTSLKQYYIIIKVCLLSNIYMLFTIQHINLVYNSTYKFGLQFNIIFLATCVPSYNQRLYEEWGCRPTTTKGKDCPSGFTCPRLWNRPNNTCFVSGTVYQNDDPIGADGIEESCRVACRCSE